MSAPVIIECALSGYSSLGRNPHIPIQPAQIAADALACLGAGASIIHNHIDDLALTGQAAADRYIEGWRPVLAARPDAIIYGTTNSAPAIAAKCAHYEPSARGGMRMGVLDPGSTNIAGTGADGLPGARQFVYTNSYADIAYTVAELERLRLGPSIAIYEPGWLRVTLAYHRAGKLPAGAFVKLYFSDHSIVDGKPGLTYGLPPTLKALEAYLELLEGSGLPWAVAAFGGDVLGSGLARHALERGGHLRVGLEDYAGTRTPSNLELVEEAVALARTAGRPVADCATAARILALPR
ncbi:MAG: 3-keto-5-aminohexanoate cleavage protein [Gammaproteobacteria bacterium]